MSFKLIGPAVGIVALLAACVDDVNNLVIVQNQFPTTTSGATGNTCSIPAERTKEFLPTGMLDVAFDDPFPYYVYPLVENRHPKVEGTPGSPNTVFVTGARTVIHPRSDISLTFGSSCPLEHTWDAAATLNPGDSYSLVVQVLRSCHAAVFKKAFEDGSYPSSAHSTINVWIDVTVEGTRSGSKESSNTYRYPIGLCYGCLQQGFGEPGYAQFDYPNTPECAPLSENLYPGNPCNPAQDFGPVLCCYTQDHRLECPARPRKTAESK